MKSITLDDTIINYLKIYYFYAIYDVTYKSNYNAYNSNRNYKYIEEFIEYLCISLSNIIYKSYHKKFLPIINIECNKILNLDILDIPREINLLAINFELLFKLDNLNFKINDKIFYSVFRFTIEFTREPDTHIGLLMFDMSMGQTISIIFFVAGTILFYKNYVSKKK